ncbi:hypothetical protein RFI_09177 [Reticulomyxa filosa]|uniref:Uncharacterized protein n=1 Tax=Reticulomyxa filosa TaxID=46433 RepID=X6NNW4_RETFI|nr:hypothetical protein RFI_09177 [Reticulomyxa filosa]|eukprot:ETO27955.1 hypothetical protein RFI_09177 [Reticulomyxa filosa]
MAGCGAFLFFNSMRQPQEHSHKLLQWLAYAPPWSGLLVMLVGCYWIMWVYTRKNDGYNMGRVGIDIPFLLAKFEKKKRKKSKFKSLKKAFNPQKHTETGCYTLETKNGDKKRKWYLMEHQGHQRQSSGKNLEAPTLAPSSYKPTETTRAQNAAIAIGLKKFKSGKLRTTSGKEDQLLPSVQEDEMSESKQSKYCNWRNDLKSVRNLVFGSYVNLLLLVVPFGFISHYLDWNSTVVFFLNFFAMMPLASILGDSTLRDFSFVCLLKKTIESVWQNTYEQFICVYNWCNAKSSFFNYLGETVGGLLNATFGNAVEVKKKKKGEYVKKKKNGLK